MRTLSNFCTAVVVKAGAGCSMCQSPLTFTAMSTPMMMVQLVGIVVLSLSLSFLAAGPAVAFAVLGMGLMQGMFGIISAATWPRFFGRTHLGAISGLTPCFFWIRVSFAAGPMRSVDFPPGSRLDRECLIVEAQFDEPQ